MEQAETVGTKNIQNLDAYRASCGIYSGVFLNLFQHPTTAPSIDISRRLSSALFPLTTIESQAMVVGLESNHRTLGEVKDISCLGLQHNR